MAFTKYRHFFNPKFRTRSNPAERLPTTFRGVTVGQVPLPPSLSNWDLVEANTLILRSSRFSLRIFRVLPAHRLNEERWISKAQFIGRLNPTTVSGPHPPVPSHDTWVSVQTHVSI